MPKKPTIREEPPGGVKEHHQAKHWRQHVACLTIDKLSELTGYGPRAIYLMEMGCTAHGKRIPDWVWLRYKMACAGVHHTRERRDFEWGQ